MTDILVQIIHGLLPSNTIALLSLIVLTFTLISVLKYTKITEELQKTAVRQQEASEKQTDELIKQRSSQSCHHFCIVLGQDKALLL